MMKSMAFLTAFFFVLGANAALLNSDKAGSSVEKVSLSKAATTEIDGSNVKLQSIGSGLRAKKVVFVNVKVYVGELFVTNPEAFKKNEALSSLEEQQAVAIQLHFLRNVDADNVQKSFKEALIANKVDVKDSPIAQFLEAVTKGGEAKSGHSLTILGVKNSDGSQSVSYETTSGNVTQIKDSEGFISKIFSIWLGTPSDDGVAALKKSLLK